MINGANRSHFGGPLLAALLLLVAAPAAADWLVTRDGARVETKGVWTIKGKLVVFALPSGTLSSLRASEVDLDASALATAEANAPPAPPLPPVKRQPVLVLTEKDIPPVSAERLAEMTASRSGGAPAEGASPAGAVGAPAEAPAAPPARTPTLEVTSWQPVNLPDGEGIEIFGMLKNSSNIVTVNCGANIRIYDEDGGLLVTGEAKLNTTALAPGKSTNFRAPFLGVLRYGKVEIEPWGIGLTGGSPEPREQETPPDPGADTSR